jgi:hypothetical protein
MDAQKEGPCRCKEPATAQPPFNQSFLDRHEQKITSNDSVPLLARISSGHYTVLQVIKGFCKRAAIAQQIVQWRGFYYLPFA